MFGNGCGRVDPITFAERDWRSSTTLAVQALEGHRMIRARRGKITILDRKTMEQVADDGYGLPEAEYARLIEGA